MASRFWRFSRTLTLAATLAGGTGLAASALATHASDEAGVASEMLAAVNAIIATLDAQPTRIETAVGYERRAMLLHPLTDASRSNLVYWPYLRTGLPIDFMTGQQRILLHDLLNTALSASGYLSATQIMQMEEILADREVTGFPRGAENYTLAIYGEPGTDNEWGWRFEGHHLSLNFTLGPAGISTTPTFMGASPALITEGKRAGLRNLRPVHEAGRELVLSLSAQQQAVAIADAPPPADIVSGTLNKAAEQWNDWQQLGDTGISIRALEPMQKDLAQRIIDEVVAVYRPEISRSYLAQIDVNELRFTWFGSTLPGAPHYYRLDGPDFFFEYDLVQGDGNHVHAVWRSKDGDFGADLLREHHLREH